MTTEPASAAPSGARRVILAIGVVAAVLALVAGLYVGTARVGAPTLSTDTLFALSLPDVEGRQQPLAQWRGKVLVVNFWATWCAPCREEMPEFVKAQEALGPRGLQFIGVAADDADKVRAFASELNLNYPALIGGLGAIELSKSYGNRIMALPFTIVIARDGRIAHTQLGPLSAAKLREVTTPLL